MAQLSHALVPVAVLCYVAAGLGFLVEFAFGRKVATPSREPELVPAGTGASSGPVDAPAPISPAPPSAARPGAVSIDPGRAAWFGRAALVVTALAVVVHITALVTRGLSVGRVPWGNMYEFVVALSLVGAVAFLVLVARRPSLRPLGVFVALAVAVLLGLADTVLYTAAAPLVPALNSYWLKIHVTAAATASGLFLVGVVPALLFLVRNGYEQGKRSFPYSLGERLPAGD